jgi:hypothetical protein
MPKSPPLKIRRSVSRTTRTGKVDLTQFTASHSFQGSSTKPVNKQAQEQLAMPSGLPFGSSLGGRAPSAMPKLPKSLMGSPATPVVNPPASASQMLQNIGALPGGAVGGASPVRRLPPPNPTNSFYGGAAAPPPPPTIPQPQASGPPPQTNMPPAIPPPPTGGGMGGSVGLPAPFDFGQGVSDPGNPMDVMGTGPSKGPVTDVPSGNTLMTPTTQWRQPGVPTATTTARVNQNMAQGRMPSGSRAATPVGGPSVPSGPSSASQGGPVLAKGAALEDFTPHTDPNTAAALAALLGLGGTAAAGGALGAAAGVPLGVAAGAARGNAAEGLGRGIVRGGMTGAGAATGAALGGVGGALASNDPAVAAMLAGAGGLAGGGLGYLTGGQLLGKPGQKQSAAYSFGSDIARTLKPKPKTTTRRDTTHTGHELNKGLREAC